jgi:hypothetical protein
MKRQYTMDQYRADVAKLYAPPWSEPPGVNGALAEALADGEAELMPAEETPRDALVQSIPPPPQAEYVPRWSGLRKRVGRDTP